MRACLAAIVTLAVFAVAGGAIFQFFGITVPAFQIVGGLLFTTMGLHTLEKGKEHIPEEDTERADPSIVPLGIPLISGPGAISTVMVLVGGASEGMHRMALAAAIGINILLTLGTLFLAPTIVAAIGETGQRIAAKIMGLITAVIGVQFAINGITTITLEILKTARS